MKLYCKIVAFGIMLYLLFGFIVPELINVSSTLLNVLGFACVLFILPLFYVTFKDEIRRIIHKIKV